MKIGDFPKTDRKIRLEIQIHCTDCGKKVPGGITTGKKYSESSQFQEDIKKLKKDYQCGRCRDKNRVQKY